MTIEPIPMTQKDTWVLSDKGCVFRNECPLDTCSKKCIFQKINARKALFKKRFPSVFGIYKSRKQKIDKERQENILKILAKEAKKGIDLASGKRTDGDLTQQIQVIKDLIKTL